MRANNQLMFWLFVGFLLAGGPELIIRGICLLVSNWQENRFWRAYTSPKATVKFSGFDPHREHRDVAKARDE